MIKIQNLSKTYNDGTSILDQVNVLIKDGEFVCFIGESGSGKTTLMNIISTLDHKYDGDLFIDNIDVKNLGNKEISNLRNELIGFVFQSFNLLSEYSVFENLEIPLLYKGISKQKRRDKIERVLFDLGIVHLIDKKCKLLSGGEKQRVAISRAIINKPKIILADEPTGNLDDVNSKLVIEELSRINKSGITVIIVTHDKNISTYCDKLYKLENKKICPVY